MTTSLWFLFADSSFCICCLHRVFRLDGAGLAPRRPEGHVPASVAFMGQLGLPEPGLAPVWPARYTFMQPSSCTVTMLTCAGAGPSCSQRTHRPFTAAALAGCSGRYWPSGPGGAQPPAAIRPSCCEMSHSRTCRIGQLAAHTALACLETQRLCYNITTLPEDGDQEAEGQGGSTWPFSRPTTA